MEYIFDISSIVDYIMEYNTIVKQNNNIIIEYNKDLAKRRIDRETMFLNKKKIDDEIKLYNKIIDNRSNYVAKEKKIGVLIEQQQQYKNQINQQEKELESKETQFTKCKSDYEKHAQKEIEKYQDKINNTLTLFHFNFSIKTNLSVKNDRRSKLTVGDITAQYIIQRKNQDALQNVDTSYLDYSLSEGEKNALGLAFFLAQLPDDMSNIILVFDDPVTSFDINRANITAKHILQYETKYTFIFTHHKAFSSKIFYYRKGNVFCLKLNNNEAKATLCNSRDFLEKDQFFEKYVELLKGREQGDLNKQRSSAREVIELILTNAYLSTIKNTDDFSTAYEKMRFGRTENGKNKSLTTVIKENEILEKQLFIFLTYYDWLSDESHSANSDHTQMDDSELKPMLENTFKDILIYMSTAR